MNAVDYYVKVLKNYTTFSGRARRAEYWNFVLINFLAVIVVSIVSAIIKVPVLVYAYELAVLLPSIAVGIRRMHDVNKSGWFLLIPLYNLYLAFTAGDVGSNQFGPDPKAT